MSLRISEKKSALRIVKQYQSEVAEIREAPPPVTAQLTIYALVAFVVGVVLICAFGRTDRVVTSLDGQIVPKESPIVVQAFDPGVIRSIDVGPGERVTKGQLLATLDPTFTQTAVDQYRSQVNAATAQIARDEAEVQQKPLEFPVLADPGFDHYAQINRSLYDQQMANFRAQLASYDQQIALTKTTIFKFQNDQARFKERVEIQDQIEGMYSTLEKHGTGSLLNSLTSSDTRIDTSRSMEFDKNSAEENTHQLQVLQANREAYLQQFLVTASQDLATGKTNLDQAQAQLTGALKHRELVRFVAPEDAQVMSIASLSVGSVLDAGRALMTLTPVSVPLEVEVKLRPATIGYIRVGDPVTLKIDAFEFTEHGTVQGVVRWISEDIVDPNRPDPTTTTGVQPAGVVLSSSGAGSQTLAYYKARIEIQKSDLRAMPAVFHFSPGMTLAADIKVGTRSVGGFLFGYVSGNLSEVLRDP